VLWADIMHCRFARVIPKNAINHNYLFPFVEPAFFIPQ